MGSGYQLSEHYEDLFSISHQAEKESMSICTVLKRWLEWSDPGRMTVKNLELFERNTIPFCNAKGIIDFFRGPCTKEESTIAPKMRECVQRWMKLRLG